MNRKANGTVVAEPGILFLVDALGTLRDVVTALIDADRPDALEQVAATLTENPDVDGCALYLKPELVLHHSPEAPFPVVQAGLGGSLLELVSDFALGILSGESARYEPDLSGRGEGLTGSLLMVAIGMRREVLGVLAVWNRAPMRFHHWHTSLLRLVSDLLVLPLGGAIDGGSASPAPRDAVKRSGGGDQGTDSRRGRTADSIASQDPLTGLLDRASFEDRLGMLATQPAGERGLLHLFYIDVDRYRLIRQFGGDQTAERVIRILGETARDVVGPGPLVGRLGQDELGILAETSGLHGAVALAQRLIASVDALRMSYTGQPVDISVSVGIAPCGGQRAGTTRALRQAQEACHAAQRQGGGTYQIFSEAIGVTMRFESDALLLNQLTCALKEERLVLFAQPIVSTAVSPEAAAIAMYEVLLRMKDKHGAFLAAATFLPLAERYGLSVKLDRWVISRAFELLSRPSSRLAKDVIFAINLSGHSIDDPRLLEFIVGQFTSTCVAPGRICFEITETAAISDIDAAKNFIRILKEIGCKFALDDFGSGHSSFLYLRDLEVDFLKIEGHLVRDITHDQVSQAFVRSIDDIGKIMGKLTIAEYVESPEVLAVVTEMGIDLAQGYAIGRPAPLEELLG